MNVSDYDVTFLVIIFLVSGLQHEFMDLSVIIAIMTHFYLVYNITTYLPIYIPILYTAAKGKTSICHLHPVNHQMVESTFCKSTGHQELFANDPRIPSKAL